MISKRLIERILIGLPINPFVSKTMMSEEEQPLLGSQSNSQSFSNYVRGNKVGVRNGGAVPGSPQATSAQRSAFYRFWVSCESKDIGDKNGVTSRYMYIMFGRLEFTATMAAPKTNKPATNEQNPVTLAYLIAYNVAQVMGWSAIMFILVSHYMTEGSNIGLYAKAAPLLNIFQTAAILEIFHCALGFVRSSVVLTAFQVFSRVMLTWGVAYSLTVVQNVFGVTMFIFAWTVTEIIRYAFYMFALIGEVPYVLQWCRYTFFIVLYPIGVTGELLSIWSGLDYVRESKIYSVELPNAANMSFSYYYFLIFVMLMYIPVFPQLYMHMLSQRKKVIGGAGKSKTD